MKISKKTSNHYKWGNNCDGWHLLASEVLSVIEENMPVSAEEKLHYHNKAQQFFYILKGEATFYIEHEKIVISQNEGIHISPQRPHKIANYGNEPLQFLVISQPRSHGDRVDL